MGCQQSKLPETKDQNDLTTKMEQKLSCIEKEQLKATSSTIKVTVKRFGDAGGDSSDYEDSGTTRVNTEQVKATSSTINVTVKSSKLISLPAIFNCCSLVGWVISVNVIPGTFAAVVLYSTVGNLII